MNRILHGRVEGFCSHYHGPLLLGLVKFRLGKAMATAAQGYQVGKLVGFQVGTKQPKRDFMVNLENLPKLLKALFGGHSAMLASPVVSALSFTLLGLPVAPVVMGLAIDKAGVILSASMGITASAATVLARSGVLFDLALRKSKGLAAIETMRGWPFCLGSLFGGCVLALRGTMFSPAVLEPACYPGKGLAAILTGQLNLIDYHAFIGWRFPQLTNGAAGRGTVFGASSPVRLHFEWALANDTINGYHTGMIA